MSSIELPEVIHPDALAKLAGVTGRRVRQVLSAAGVRPVSRGCVELEPAFRALLDAARGDKAATPEAKARAELAKARAAEVELRLAEKSKTLIAMQDAQEALERLVGVVNAELAGLSASVTRDMSMRRRVDEATMAMRGRIARRLRAEAERIRKGGEA